MGMQRWHTLSSRATLSTVSSRPSGLSDTEAKERLEKYGPNELKPPKPRAAALIFLVQFTSTLVLLLIAATAISLALGLIVDATVIAAILIANAVLGFMQEWRAERTVAAMRKLIIPTATVLRDGQKQPIDSRELVPGDIIFLSEGQHIPADCRIIRAFDLRTDESALTGESTPVEKNEKPLADVPLAERKNMIFMGTMTVAGSGEAVVVSTGIRTEFGTIAHEITIIPEVTTLQKRLGTFGVWLGLAVVVAGALVFALGTAEGRPVFDMFLTAVALAVSAVPEGLPAVVTVTLAAGALTMTRKRTIVRRLAAIEELGNVTVIAADKTGTMTKNEMTVRQIWCADKNYSVTGIGFEPEGEFVLDHKRIVPKGPLKLLLAAGAACNNALLHNKGGWHIVGDPTEGALLVAAAKAGVPLEWKRLWEIPFSSDRSRMTTVNQIDDDIYAFTKGSPEKMLEMCNRIQLDRLRALRPKERKRLLNVVEKFAEDGKRIIGIAYKPLKKKWKKAHLERDMIFLGFVAMEDPPRPEVATALRTLKAAGIRTIMLTGDHVLTAKAIAKQIGITRGLVLTGTELDAMDDTRLQEIINDISILARITPAHKVRVVRILQKAGHVPAVTGDGINDAPALKLAEVGIAMGIKGTDVAKEASDMVLADDNYATIALAVKEGRAIWDNIRKFVRFLLTVNFSEIALIATTLLAGFPLPLLPIQILWINLVTDGPPALALGIDPADPNIMRRKPRPSGQSILHGMLPFVVVGGALAFATELLAFLVGFGNSIEYGRTMALTTAVLFELFFVFNCRSERLHVWASRPFENRKLLLAVAIAIIAQLLVIYLPSLQAAFGTVALSATDWALILPLAASGLLISPKMFIKS
jgi:Ca2+-transporting ATPase